jgi:hypothetical protein
MTQSKSIKFWWWDGSWPGNLGDILTPLILDHFGIPYTHSRDFEAISTGSIVKVARAGTIVLGSGIIGLRDYACPAADYRFVRGPYTRQHVLSFGGTCPEIYGDPAMLMPEIIDPAPKLYDLGIVPHYSHYEEAKKRYPKHMVINLRTNNCVETIKQITQCRHIVSSSLHGIILAHAYGIPAAWTEFSTGLKGDGVKFLDHYASVGITDPVKSTVKNPVFTTAGLDLNPLKQAFETLRDQIQ